MGARHTARTIEKEIANTNKLLREMANDNRPRAYRAVQIDGTIKMQLIGWTWCAPVEEDTSSNGWQIIKSIASGTPRECTEAMTEHFHQFQINHWEKRVAAQKEINNLYQYATERRCWAASLVTTEMWQHEDWEEVYEQQKKVEGDYPHFLTVASRLGPTISDAIISTEHDILSITSNAVEIWIEEARNTGNLRDDWSEIVSEAIWIEEALA